MLNGDIMTPIQVLLHQLAKVLHFWGPDLTDFSIQKHNRIQWTNQMKFLQFPLLRAAQQSHPEPRLPTVESKAQRRSRCSRQTLTDAALFARLLHTRTFRPRHSTDLSRSPVIIQSCPPVAMSTLTLDRLLSTSHTIHVMFTDYRRRTEVREVHVSLVGDALLGCRGFEEKNQSFLDFL